jgi:hypothetical protein
MGRTRSSLERLCLGTFLVEGWINLISGVLLMVYPTLALDTFGVVDARSSVGDMIRWFGSVVIILGWIGLRAPVSPENIQALLLGDIAYLFVYFHFIENHGTHTVAGVLSCVVLVVFLAVVRTVYLTLVVPSQSKEEKLH